MDENTKELRRGTSGAAVFHGGRLFIERPSASLWVSAWPDLEAWRRDSNQGDWRTCADPGLNLQWMQLSAEDPDEDAAGQGRLPFPSPRADEAEAYRAFLSTIPQPVLDWSCRYQEGYWRILNAFRHLGPAAQDLCCGGAFSLLFMLAHLDRFCLRRRQHSWALARSLARMPQRDALADLGFPQAESTARLMRNVPPESCSIRNLRRLRKLIRTPAHIRLLRHLPRINAGVIVMLGAAICRDLCSMKLLTEVGLATSNDEAPITAWDLGEIAHLAGQVTNPPEAMLFNSLSEVDAAKSDLWGRFNRTSVPGEFPTPPFPGMPGMIDPITTSRELASEGRAMLHCAAQYANLVRAGQAYFYRVAARADVGLERATLMIERRGVGWRWLLRELRGRGNLRVSQTTKAIVRRFLAAAQGGTASGEELRTICLATGAGELQCTA